MRIASLLVLIGLTAACGSLPAQEAATPEPPKLLSVTLASGRTFTGHVDWATSAERLVLRIERAGISLTRPIAWNRITAAKLAGEDVELPRLREAAEAVKSKPSLDSRLPTPDPRPDSEGREAKAPAEPPLTHVASISIDPRLANWDADVETDGLLVDVLPLDAEGYLAAAGGTIEIELHAPQRRVFHHAPLSGGDTLERVERWTRSVQASDFGPSGVRLKLPFGAVHPEFDLDWMGVGLVHVKFTAPGHGVLEDSRDAVRIRPFAPLRDQLEMNTGRRFVPTEGVGRRD